MRKKCEVVGWVVSRPIKCHVDDATPGFRAGLESKLD